MLKLNQSIGMGLLACSFIVLAACGTTVSKVDSQGETNEPVFPAVEQASRPEGTYVNLENLQKIASGVSKRQLIDLIGAPHFSEGLFGVREWDYILKFREPAGQPDKVCQYKVLFDDQMLARSFYFEPADCMAPAPEKAQHAAAPARVENLTLATDATFAFGSAVLQPEGKAKLSEFAAHLELQDVTGIDIVGYTDRIGRPEQNIRLSLNRANAVRSYLIQSGVPASIISVDGRGAADPVVACPGLQKAELVDCLAPNRRTTVTILSH
ncbi:OmpA family protein [Pseudomonas schmalbachii]|uniref:OmpA family protein n=1 Tax=Pseudomonas schmalbachii TaxID=2816993 RepID=A0ABS3TSE6_9PSED|nr:OmpA family protein [Pseudomonas schmalbachii]MBO3275489.1 OmpA family protein [Pseudomonas schmalbachii]